jgi:hypothetical protein
MPQYYFNLQDDRAGVLDVEGTDLPDLAAAKDYATRIARELMRQTETEKRAWRLDVFDGSGDLVLRMPFAAVDPTLDHLEPALRKLIESLCESRCRLAETLFSSDVLVRHARAAKARRRGKPYLAAWRGQRVDSPPAKGVDQEQIKAEPP